MEQSGANGPPCSSHPTGTDPLKSPPRRRPGWALEGVRAGRRAGLVACLRYEGDAHQAVRRAAGAAAGGRRGVAGDSAPGIAAAATAATVVAAGAPAAIAAAATAATAVACPARTV